MATPTGNCSKSFLKRAGLEVVTAVNGLEAVEKASKQAFNLILMDMQMPVMDGYTAVARLRKEGRPCRLLP